MNEMKENVSETFSCNVALSPSHINNSIYTAKHFLLNLDCESKHLINRLDTEFDQTITRPFEQRCDLKELNTLSN